LYYFLEVKVNKAISLFKEQQNDIYQQMAQMMGALASPVRLKIIHFLSQAPLTVEVLASKCEQSVANTSMHLRKMLGEKVLRVETLGQKRLYSLHSDLSHFFEECLDFAQALNPLLKLTEEFDAPFSLKQIKQMLDDKELTLLDVRPEEESSLYKENFNDSNVLFIPAESIKKEIESLPKRKALLVVCRGRFCVLSLDIVKKLREEGYKAYRSPYSWHKLKSLFTKEHRSKK
jgi:DNA-binding transcriptional ArsR family regulator